MLAKDHSAAKPLTIEEEIAARRAKGAAIHRLGVSLHRASQAWDDVTTQKQWEAIVRDAQARIENGRFLLSRLGAQMHLEPEVVAALLVLREGLIREHDAKSPAQLMLIDMTILSYYNGLRAQRMLGDLATQIEFEFFSREAPSVRVKREAGGYVPNGFYVEDMLDRASETLQVLLDRANRMLVRNLQALSDLQRGALVIHADQVNFAERQLNVNR